MKHPFSVFIIISVLKTQLFAKILNIFNKNPLLYCNFIKLVIKYISNFSAKKC